MPDIAGAKHDEVAVDQSAPAPADAHTFHSTAQGGPDHGPDCRIHARRITAAGEHADPLNCIGHVRFLLCQTERVITVAL